MAMAEGERTECAEPARDEPPADGALKRAEELKTQANEYFKAKDYENAIKFYSQAIELNPSNAIYYGNRSLAYLRTECYGYALGDATRAIEIDKKYIKGYYRRAASNMALGKFRAALRDYETVVKVKPHDKDAKMKYQECNKIVKQKAFERAIAGDEHKRSVVDSLDIESMTIEDEYSGPKLEDGKVTITFMKELMQWYKDQKKLHRKCAYQILVQVKEVLSKLSTLVETTLKETEKITVCGDTHGQFYDLLNIFELNGLPSETNPYIFNGDFVDRGSFSVEVILTLFGFKLLYPDHFHLLRGNHETDNMNQIYGFEGEVKAKYTAQMYELFSEVFEWLPLAQCINGKVLIMHGGLFSEDGVTLDDIRKIERNRQPPDSGEWGQREAVSTRAGTGACVSYLWLESGPLTGPRWPGRHPQCRVRILRPGHTCHHHDPTPAPRREVFGCHSSPGERPQRARVLEDMDGVGWPLRKVAFQLIPQEEEVSAQRGPGQGRSQQE
uniref:serine/threonine-protein phosphatase 5 isoform X2 n=1 Tax=Ictidomys tridecemlineatus TaxID=43179 RepID=UPI001A9F4BF7|nr:serine/threonine-protein phosphatase 5 isoform X2 [Ictidomys tridecemlineatus]